MKFSLKFVTVVCLFTQQALAFYDVRLLLLPEQQILDAQFLITPCPFTFTHRLHLYLSPSHWLDILRKVPVSRWNASSLSMCPVFHAPAAWHLPTSKGYQTKKSPPAPIQRQHREHYLLYACTKRKGYAKPKNTPKHTEKQSFAPWLN